ncbi:MAG TPA: CoA-binding protein [Niabella sp.]|nr:CoA-binding protein [Niabella sp.]
MQATGKKKTLILGASANPQRYSYLALNRLRDAGHEVVAIGKKNTMVKDVPVDTEKKPYPGVHTVTLYLNPAHQKEYYDYILSLHPQRIIFNPGAENEHLLRMDNAQGIETLEAFTLVLLSTGQY